MAATDYKASSPARGARGGYQIYLNPGYYGTSPINFIGSEQSHGSLLSHETAHNFGLTHPSGDESVYPSLGLMSIKAKTIYPTVENSINIFNYRVGLQLYNGRSDEAKFGNVSGLLPSPSLQKISESLRKAKLNKQTNQIEIPKN